MLAADEPVNLVRERLLRAIDVVGDALPCDAARLGDRLPRGRGPPTLCHRLLAADLKGRMPTLQRGERCSCAAQRCTTALSSAQGTPRQTEVD